MNILPTLVLVALFGMGLVFAFQLMQAGFFGFSLGNLSDIMGPLTYIVIGAMLAYIGYIRRAIMWHAFGTLVSFFSFTQGSGNPLTIFISLALIIVNLFLLGRLLLSSKNAVQ